IERFFNKIKHSRRAATRYDKLASSFLGFVQLATIRCWIRFVHTTSLGLIHCERSEPRIASKRNSARRPVANGRTFCYARFLGKSLSGPREDLLRNRASDVVPVARGVMQSAWLRCRDP
ncbi:MAG: transposase, partial [Burkholderiales bacterium]|nr:transposase [Burkholderiales bacterium]